MASRPRIRKRISAIRRAPDGSAFEKCECCGVSVAIALDDMHECEPKNDVKRFRDISGKQTITKQRLSDQPRSAFRFFMDSFLKTCEAGNSIEVDQKGFQTWKDMSKKERQGFVMQAEMVNSTCHKALLKEVKNIFQVDDEADSAMVEKFPKVYKDHTTYEYFESFENSWSCGLESLNTLNWE